MDCGHDRRRPEEGDFGMNQTDGRSVSGCQENRDKPASLAWSCPNRDAARDENGRSGFNRARKSGIVRSNRGSSGECRVVLSVSAILPFWVAGVTGHLANVGSIVLLVCRGLSLMLRERDAPEAVRLSTLR